MFYRPLLCCAVLLLGLYPSLSFSQVSVDFSANETSGCGSLQVSFIDQSSSTAGAINSWAWDLGGVSSSNQNPGRIFGLPGQYTVCLTVTDVAGNTGSVCKTDYIRVFDLPQPGFDVTMTDGCVPSTITFTDLSTSANGTITEWIWGVGGEKGVVSSTGSQAPFDNTYSLADSYTISLTVIDDNNCINTLTEEDFITIHPDPTIDLSADQTFGCEAPFTVNFTNESPDLSINYKWIFSNGIEFEGTNPPPITFSDVGFYDVTLIGTSGQTGCTDTLFLTDYIQVGYPIDFSYTPEDGCFNLEVAFTDLSPDPASTVAWDFGDGNASSDPNPVHTYTNPGCYTVVLSRLVNGCMGLEVSETCIDVYSRPEGSITQDNRLGCTSPHLVNFTSTTIDAVSWTWDFGDGQTSDLPNPSHTYNSSGIFPVSLLIRNAEGCARKIIGDTIEVVPLQSRFIDNEEQGCTPLTFTLQENAQTVAPITSWEWVVSSNASSPPLEFFSTDESPTFTLVDTGFYDVALIVTNDIGCRDTSIYEKAVAVGMPPTVDFVANPLASCINTAVFFTDQSSDYTNAWYWEFGDGGTSEDQHPFYEYADTGRFDVRLTALHHGCPNELLFEQYVEVTPPKAGFLLVRDCADPYTIQFTDTSIGADSTYYDFGVLDVETDTSSSREPVYTYPNTGDYAIAQYVYNFETGCADTFVLSLTITDPLADFSISTNKGCVPFTLEIEDHSNFATQYLWSSSGAEISDSTAAEPEITYTSSGMYHDLTLVILDINGCTDSLVYNDTIWANQVNPDFTVIPEAGCLPLLTTFTDNSSSVFGNIVSWRWEFGDGNLNTTDQHPVHTYDSSGYFEVLMRATDDWGCIRWLRKDSLVEVTQPVADFIAEDTVGCSTYSITFNNQSRGKQLSYSWNFGDGETSSEASPVHQYTQEGVYTVCLEVTDLYGCDSTFCREDYVVIADPVAQFTPDQTFGNCPPLLVNFSNQSLNANTYEWDFGDDSGSSTLENPPHLYTIPGTFDVQLIAIATENCKDTLVIEDLIELDGPRGDFHFDIDTSCAPATITFFGESIEIYDYIWDFGNGDLDTTLQVLNDTVSYIYNNDGHFVPKLILIDASECKRTLQSPDTIVIGSLNVNFIADRTILCDNNSTVNFFNLTGSSDPILSYNWAFDGGSPDQSNLVEPVVNYNGEGLYDVKLIVDNGICFDSLNLEEYIRIGAVPEVAFAMSDTTGCAPFTIQFSDSTTVQNANIVEWNWDFGDQTSAAIQNPVHIYNEVGTYDIQLNVVSNIGCEDSTTLSISTMGLPEVSISTGPSICIGEFAQLTADIGTNTVGTTYRWLPSPDLTCTDCLDPLANPQDTTIYTLIVTGANGCSRSADIQVDVKPFPAPIISLTADTTICANDLVQLQVSGGDNLLGYQWGQDRFGLSCYEACINPIATPANSTTYVVSVTNTFGCLSMDSVRLDIVDQAQTFAGDNQSICEGDEVQLQTSMGNDPQWLVTNGLDCVHCPDPMAAPEESTNYLVRVTTDEGCEIFDSVYIEVFHPEDVDAGDPTTVCAGEALVLNGTGQGTVTWSPAQSLDNPNTLQPTARPQSPTTYWMSVDNGACVLTDSVVIDLREGTEIFTEEVSICSGDSIELVVDGEADQYFWEPLPGLSATDIANPVASPTETTHYQVIASIDNCAPDTAIATVEVIQGPNITMPNYVNYFPGQQIRLSAEIRDSSVYSYEWGPAAGLDCTDCPNPSISPDSTSLYIVTVTDEMTGCSSQSPAVLVAHETCPLNILGIPNVFSPNGDGNNDRLELFPTPAIEEIISYRVFDRWGSLIYQTTNINDAWDGTFKGRPLPSGVYVYMIEMHCEIDGSILVKSGDVTLLR